MIGNLPSILPERAKLSRQAWAELSQSEGLCRAGLECDKQEEKVEM